MKILIWMMLQIFEKRVAPDSGGGIMKA